VVNKDDKPPSLSNLDQRFTADEIKRRLAHIKQHMTNLAAIEKAVFGYSPRCCCCAICGHPRVMS
jgi:hypothetical protein